MSDNSNQPKGRLTAERAEALSGWLTPRPYEHVVQRRRRLYRQMEGAGIGAMIVTVLTVLIPMQHNYARSAIVFAMLVIAVYVGFTRYRAIAPLHVAPSGVVEALKKSQTPVDIRLAAMLEPLKNEQGYLLFGQMDAAVELVDRS